MASKHPCPTQSDVLLTKFGPTYVLTDLPNLNHSKLTLCGWQWQDIKFKIQEQNSISKNVLLAKFGPTYMLNDLPNLNHSEVTLCGWQDIKIQELTLNLKMLTPVISLIIIYNIKKGKFTHFTKSCCKKHLCMIYWSMCYNTKSENDH